MDYAFIPNTQHPTDSANIGRNAYYKNKYGVKLTDITNDVGLPLDIRIDSGNQYTRQ